MRTRSEAKKTAATPKRATSAQNQDVKMRTPKSGKKKADIDTPLRVDDLLSSQHFGSQIEVGWDCNSPDALRNIQRYQGGCDTEVSEIVMQLLNEEPQVQPSQSSENLIRISPPPLGLWKTLKGPTESCRPQRRLRSRKKSGEESSLQDNLLETLRDALKKCEKTDEPNGGKAQKRQMRKSQLTKEAPLKDCNADLNESFEEVASEDKRFLNYSKDLFESTKVKDQSNEAMEGSADEDETLKACEETVKECDEVFNDGDAKLDKSDATWSDDELFEEDSFIIKATQFPESLKSFNSPMLGMKRKTLEDNTSSKSKSPRYSFQIDAKTDLNSNKVVSVNSNLRRSAMVRSVSAISGDIGKPPIGISKHVTSSNSVNKKPASCATKAASLKLHDKLNNPNCGNNSASNLQAQNVPLQISCATLHAKKGAMTLDSSVGSSTNNCRQTKSKQFASSRCQKSSSGPFNADSVSEICANPVKSSLNSASTSVTVSNPKKFSFKKHNSFHGQDSDKSTAGNLTRQRSFSGTNTSSCPTVSSTAYCSSAGDTNATILSKQKTDSKPSLSSTKFNTADIRVSNKSVSDNIISVKSSSKLVLSTTKTSSSVSSNSLKSCANSSSVVSASIKPIPVTCSKRDVNSLSLKTPGISTSSAEKIYSDIGTSNSSSCINKSVVCSKAKGSHVRTSSAISKSCSSVSLSTTVTARAQVASSKARSSVSLDNLFSKINYPPVKKTIGENCDDSMKESPVFPAKKRLSTGVFDTSLSDDLLCQMAEPDDVLDSQIVNTTMKPVSKQTNSVTTSSCTVSAGSQIPCVSKTSTIVPLSINTVKPGVCTNQGSVKQNQNNVGGKCVPNTVLISKGAGSKTYSFKTSQKPRNMQCDSKLKSEHESESSRSTSVFRQPTKGPDKTATVTKTAAPVVANAYSEDLFSDDDDFLDDGLTEPEILAMLDEVESTQQTKASQELDNRNAHQNSEGHGQASSQGQMLTPTKYSPSDIEKKKKEALKRRENKLVSKQLSFSQETASNLDQANSPGYGQSSSQGQMCTPTKYSPSDIEKKKLEALRRRENKMATKKLEFSQEAVGNGEQAFSQDQQLTPTKYSPSDIEKKKAEALKRRQSSMAAKQLRLSQELNYDHCGVSPDKGQPLSQGHSCSSSGSDKGFDNSQGHLSSPAKYSQSDIEKKRQEAVRKRHLSSSQESKANQGHSPNKVLSLNQGQHSSDKMSNESSEGQTLSPVKYSQIDIERKKQEALKRRKLKAASASGK